MDVQSRIVQFMNRRLGIKLMSLNKWKLQFILENLDLAPNITGSLDMLIGLLSVLSLRHTDTLVFSFYFD